MLKSFLAHPLTKGKNIDDPSTTELRKTIIRNKDFLRQIYLDWYAEIKKNLPKIDGGIVELGSGGGFLSESLPELITSDVMPLKDLSLIFDARRPPFRNSSLKAIVMLNVLHHIPSVQKFFSSATAILKDGGRIIILEPWLTKTSRWVYKNLHHEPLDEKCIEWELPTTGPLSGANEALPWILFHRDRKKFEKLFPEFKIVSINQLMPFSYILSGGVALRSLFPGALYPFIRKIEGYFEKKFKSCGMFAFIILEKNV
ncbi:MAG: methyltransferase domain-containing protein [Candidatus Riflebacteria bacterium]|nr:methyltransferase domain-containing protein [Candidatus Riflebacteria bacterium]